MKTFAKPCKENSGDFVPALNKKSSFAGFKSGRRVYKEHQQLEEATVIVNTQERERNAIGMELHDNVNQILVSTKLLLSAVEAIPADQGLLDACVQI